MLKERPPPFVQLPNVPLIGEGVIEDGHLDGQSFAFLSSAAGHDFGHVCGGGNIGGWGA